MTKIKTTRRLFHSTNKAKKRNLSHRLSTKITKMAQIKAPSL